MRKTKKKTSHQTAAQQTEIAPFVEHLHELRRRIYFIVIGVLLFGGLAYSIQQHIVYYLLRPAKGQQFIYTSPGGGIDFLFKVCLYCGLVISTPVIVYNVLGFIEPLITNASKRFLALSSLTCGVLALAGVAFGYFIGLPSALHFLFHQFTTIQIKPLVTIQSYLSFVIAYLMGSALLFQLPVILVCINRIKPLKPSKLLGYERWVILAAFVLAGLMNPSPNLLSQLIVAVPFIMMYQVGILLIAFINRPRSTKTARPVPEPFRHPASSPSFQPFAMPQTPPPVETLQPMKEDHARQATKPIVSQGLAMDSLKAMSRPRPPRYDPVRRSSYNRPRQAAYSINLSRPKVSEDPRFMDFVTVKI